MNHTVVFDRYITVLGVKDLSGCMIGGFIWGYPLPKQVGSIVIEVGKPCLYHKGNSTFEFPIYSDINYTRAECGFWFIGFEKYLGIDLMDLAVWITTKYYELNYSPHLEVVN